MYEIHWGDWVVWIKQGFIECKRKLHDEKSKTVSRTKYGLLSIFKWMYIEFLTLLMQYANALLRISKA